MTTNSDELTLGAISIPHNYEYADAAARLAVVTLPDKAVGMLALQADKGSLWRVRQVSPCIIWERVSGEDETEAAANYVIDHVNGDDDTGNGSSSYPWKSFRGLLTIGRKICHRTYVEVKASDAYDYMPPRNHFEAGGGSLIIDASGEDEVVLAGPFTATAVNGVGDAGVWGVPYATDITVAGESWTPDEYHSRHIRFENGAFQGHLVPILKNTGDTLRTHQDAYGWAVGFEFSIVREPVTVTVSHAIEWSSNRADNSEEFLFVAGIRFVAAGVNFGERAFKLRNINALFSFCSLVRSDVGEVPMIMENSSIQMWQAPAGTFANTALNSIWSYGLFVSPNNGSPSTGGRDIELFGYRNEIGMVCLRGKITSMSAEGSYIGFSLIGGFENQGQSTNIIDQCFYEQIGYADRAFLCHDGYTYVLSAWIDGTARAISVRNKAGCRLDWLKGANITEDYAAEVSAGGRIRRLGSNVSIVGAVGAVEFSFNSGTHATWPAAGPPGYTDGAGSWVTTE